MARVTVEDCLDYVDNRFQLVLIATKRARQLVAGQEARLPWENDKPTVMALREIAEQLVDASVLDEVATDEVEQEEVAEASTELQQVIESLPSNT